MNINLKNQTEEEEKPTSCFMEFLDKGLLEILSNNSNAKDYHVIDNDKILSEAYQLSERIEKEKSSDSDYHQLFHELKLSLGSYYAASITMSIVFAIHSLKFNLCWQNQLLLGKIAKRYKLRPWMDDIHKLVKDLKRIQYQTAALNQLGEKKIILKLEGAANINVYSSGNFIGKTISYGKQ